MSSIATKKKKDCSGCNACAEACPKHCIEMIPDKKGFLYPKVDTSTCIDCGVCTKVCPFEDGNIHLKPPLTAYAAWNKDREQYLASSSGGAAQVFSSYIINQGGVVYGCTSDDMRIRHIRVDALSDLHKLQGSKYVQSDVRELFSKVKADLKANKPVLFIGTPCQVAGLKNYIKQIPEHLYLVDLICHGVPSQQMLNEHIAHVLNGRTAKQISFRKGEQFRFEITTQYGAAYFAEYHKDKYYRAFFNGISYRESCYRCPFARKERASDITIGDFWGLQNAASLPLNKEEGISVMLPLTEKGNKLISATKLEMHAYERNAQEAIDGNTQLQCPMKGTLSRRIFNALYPILPFDTAVMCSIIHCKIRTLFKICTNRITHGFVRR